MFVTSGQGYYFLLCVLTGGAVGVLYEACFLIRFCLKRGLIATVVLDVIFSAAAGLVVLAAFHNYLLEFRLYVFLGIILGIILERISLGFLIAKCANLVYNVAIKLKTKILSSRLSGFFRKVFK